MAREISLPDAERINYLGAFALRQSQRNTSTLDPGEADAPAGAAAPPREHGVLSLERIHAAEASSRVSSSSARRDSSSSAGSARSAGASRSR